MASTKIKMKGKSRTMRKTSNIFAMFSQEQIQEFKEAFKIIDQDRDEVVGKDDLKKILVSMGKDPTDEYIEEMLREAPSAVNFTMFLTMFGDHLTGTDPADVIRNAFSCFDEKGTGRVKEEKLKELLTTMADRFTEEEVALMFQDAPVRDGYFYYNEFIDVLKNGRKDDDYVDTV